MDGATREHEQVPNVVPVGKFRVVKIEDNSDSVYHATDRDPGEADPVSESNAATASTTY